jgi:uncharacterized phage-associated protein
MSASNAPSVAARVLTVAGVDGSSLTNMQLQKLVFLVQSCELSEHAAPAFHEDVQAWQHGPVVGSVYRTYKFFGDDPIEAIDHGQASSHEVPARTLDAVEKVWDLFGGMTGSELRRLTHDRGPWPAHYRDDRKSIVLPRHEIGEAWSSYTSVGQRRKDNQAKRGQLAEALHPPIGVAWQTGHLTGAASPFRLTRPTRNGG